MSPHPTTLHRHLLDRGRLLLPQIPYLVKTLRLVFSSAPGWTLAWILLLVVQGILPVATVVLMKRVVDSLVALSGNGIDWQTLSPGLFWIGLMVLLMVLNHFFTSAGQWIRTGQSERVQDHMTDLIHQKSASVDLAFYDSSEYYDQLHRARMEGSYRPMALMDSLASLFQNGITVLAMLGTLLPYGKWVPFAALGGVLPATVVLLGHAVREYQWRLRVTSDERRAWYYYAVLTDRASAPEIRLFGLGDSFRFAYRALRDRLRGEKILLTQKQAMAEGLSGFAGLVVTALLMAWMVSRLLRGSATLGDLALFYQVFARGQAALSATFAGVRGLYTNSLFLGTLYAFLNLKPLIQSPPCPEAVPDPIRTGFQLTQVSFAYPGSERTGLQGLDLNIPARSMTAIVGPNGAGKSTLVKLLCRFYDPDEGQIELDGTDLRSLSLEELRASITVLFQDPVRYHATVRENIAPGLTEPIDESRLKRAIDAAGLQSVLDRLPQGCDTLLGKMFKDGTDLSHGEWLRIALARAFFRETPIIIFDEPTSVMDPWAESDWIQRFKELVAGKTSLIITHRFTTARHADLLFVMEEGRIAESGSFQDLLAQEGRFSEAWRAQVLGEKV